MFTFTSTSSYSFSTGGCEGDCNKCHALSTQEVKDILKKLNNPQLKVLGIQLSPLKSLWEVAFEDKGNKGVFYIDFSKKHLVEGPLRIIEISPGSDSAGKAKETKKADVSKIPLKEALVVGNRKAAKKVIVFTDPD